MGVCRSVTAPRHQKTMIKQNLEGLLMLFTVIVPVYNVEKYLTKCIDSILSQTFTDFEVILVDDGSTDRCPEICDAYEKKDDRVKVIHKTNGGLVSARNAGIFVARGDYITYVDGDDWIKPNLLQFVRDRIAESSEKVDMVIFSGERVFSDHLELIDHHIAEGWYNRERLEKEVFPWLIMKWMDGRPAGHRIEGYTWNKPCRRELQQAYYVRDERIKMFTDEPLTYECLLNCQNVYICNEPLYMYNKTNANSILTLGNRNYLTKSFGYLLAYMNERLKGYGPDIERQLIEYPIFLIRRTMNQKLKTESSFRQAVKSLKAGLKESGMLRYIPLRKLPKEPRFFLILLLKLRMYQPAMLLFAIKLRRDNRKK